MENLLNDWAFEQGSPALVPSVCDQDSAFKHTPIIPHMDRPAPSAQSRAF
jgi:hypothetical protein